VVTCLEGLGVESDVALKFAGSQTDLVRRARAQEGEAPHQVRELADRSPTAAEFIREIGAVHRVLDEPAGRDARSL
jgi:hypothetical protein